MAELGHPDLTRKVRRALNKAPTRSTTPTAFAPIRRAFGDRSGNNTAGDGGETRVSSA